MMFSIGNFLKASRRVLVVSKKPDWQEYQMIAKVTGIGIIIIAAIGFVITLIMNGLGLGI